MVRNANVLQTAHFVQDDQCNLEENCTVLMTCAKALDWRRD
jgi:hypothetical protein